MFKGRGGVRRRMMEEQGKGRVDVRRISKVTLLVS